MRICVAHYALIASNVLPLPVSRRWSPQANDTARLSANTARPRIRAGVSRDMPVYFLSLRPVLIPAWAWLSSAPRWFTKPGANDMGRTWFEWQRVYSFILKMWTCWRKHPNCFVVFCDSREKLRGRVPHSQKWVFADTPDADADESGSGYGIQLDATCLNAPSAGRWWYQTKERHYR